MRIAIGGISHESSTFTTVETTRASFSERYGDLVGGAILDKFRGVNTPIGGFIAVAEEHGLELIPTIFADAMPSAPATRVVFEELLAGLIDGINGAGTIDGVLLELHGAMVAEGVDDGEGDILQAVRECVGSQVPIVAQLRWAWCNPWRRRNSPSSASGIAAAAITACSFSSAVQSWGRFAVMGLLEGLGATLGSSSAKLPA